MTRTNAKKRAGSETTQNDSERKQRRRKRRKKRKKKKPPPCYQSSTRSPTSSILDPKSKLNVSISPKCTSCSGFKNKLPGLPVIIEKFAVVGDILAEVEGVILALFLFAAGVLLLIPLL